MKISQFLPFSIRSFNEQNEIANLMILFTLSLPLREEKKNKF